MKRGFLNSQKAKPRAEKVVRSESSGPPRKKSKDDDENSEISDEGVDFVDLNMIDPHKLPKSVQARYQDKRRVIFRAWPRDPKGKTIVPSPIRGKEAANGLDLWGATLFDFFRVNRLPTVHNYVTTSTGSRLAKWMRQAGELTAVDELYWADKEDDPKEIPVADIGELIKCYDTRVFFGMFNRFSTRKEVRRKAYSEEEEEEDETNEAAPHNETAEAKANTEEDPISPVHVNAENEHGEEPMSVDPAENDGIPSTQLHQPMHTLQLDDARESSSEKGADQAQTDRSAEKEATASAQFDEPMQLDEAPETSPAQRVNQPSTDELAASVKCDSPFDPIHYPSPWPFIPCTKSHHENLPIIQQRIPLHLLPRKLHVHDPWNRLSIDEEGDINGTPWLRKVANNGDIIRTYSLSLSEECQEAASKACERAKMEYEKASKSERMVQIFPAAKEGPTDEPLIEVILPPQPPKRMQVEEAHLYIAPPVVGTGNHSVVYDAEWELPRDLFFEPHICRMCVEEDVREQFQALKDQGKWEELLLTRPKDKHKDVLRSGPGGSPAAGPSRASILKRPVGHVTITEHQVPEESVSFIDQEDLDSDPKKDKGKGKEQPEMNKKAEEKRFTMRPPKTIRTASYDGPVLQLQTRVKWQDPPKCSHFGLSPSATPRTATVRVIAKLSFEHDTHLAREAKNYQSFPSHFFEHWSGYNVVPPLHDPIPVGALCPQFYGYYTPDDPTDGKDRSDYLSPILLLEHCGSEIDPDTLDEDDKQECASLLFRFHHAGWLHESFAARNVLWQQGKPTEWPIQRAHSTKSFRLIDFGRSKKIDKSSSRMSEEAVALRLFHLHDY